jgi:hypothetical protein
MGEALGVIKRQRKFHLGLGVVNNTASLCREPWEIAMYFPSAENAQPHTFPELKCVSCFGAGS